MDTRKLAAAFLAAPVLCATLVACGGTGEPVAKASSSTPVPSQTPTPKVATYFEGLPRFTFDTELDCDALQPGDLAPLAKRMFPSVTEPERVFFSQNTGDIQSCRWVTGMSDTFNFQTGTAQIALGRLETDTNLSVCYEQKAPENRLDTAGLFTAAWLGRGGYCSGGSTLYAVALSEDEQSAAVCTYHFHYRDTDMGQEPIVDLGEDPVGQKIFVQTCGQFFDSIKS